MERRRERVDRTRALTRRQLERLFARRGLTLPSEPLWQLLETTAASTNELLALDVEGRDLGQVGGREFAARVARSSGRSGRLSAQQLLPGLQGRRGEPGHLADANAAGNGADAENPGG